MPGLAKNFNSKIKRILDCPVKPGNDEEVPPIQSLPGLTGQPSILGDDADAESHKIL